MDRTFTVRRWDWSGLPPGSRLPPNLAEIRRQVGRMELRALEKLRLGDTMSLDGPTIRAMRESGKSSAEIAKDLGVSIQAVS